MKEPAFRAAALYNRGNSALAAKAYEHAIRDYTGALRLQPNDVQAKRNLEIALAKRDAARQQAGKQPEPQTGAPQHPPQPSPSAKPEGPRQEADSEALLRSVQQQEQEELARMKKVRASRARVGW
jgi:tetratricopeptide (TPR) repeat protein